MQEVKALIPAVLVIIAAGAVIVFTLGVITDVKNPFGLFLFFYGMLSLIYTPLTFSSGKKYVIAYIAMSIIIFACFCFLYFQYLL